MSKLGCICGNVIRDQTDFLPYLAFIREDEDTQKPTELLADLLARYYEARQKGRGAEFVAEYERGRGEEWLADHLTDKPLAEVLSNLIYPFWNNYDRRIYECEECGRLWVELEGSRYAPYLPETEDRHVLRSRHNPNPYGRRWD